ncbi:hypothetical protein CGI20_24900 [Vibrio parahaemolyticus]|nr:hypothetical protein Vp2S01_1320 [Vibrio parahaemolyticus]TOK32302.1 hypothetical protein CGI20_24900 [Vibrio parahaemolyticus]TOL77492.1 hypothetical protein CGH90_25075 [Vibrio parahaemolyticus]
MKLGYLDAKKPELNAVNRDYWPEFLGFLHIAYNAALRGEQRIPPKLSHCAVNTKAGSNQNCQAL